MALTVADLTAAPKKLSSPPVPKVKSHSEHREVDIAVESEVPGRFVVSVRVNTRLSEMFSIVLWYESDEGATTVLMRLNGDHGLHRNPDGSHLTGAHVHEHTPEAQREPPDPDAAPSHATPLRQSSMLLLDARQEFKKRVTINDTPKVDAVIRKLQILGAQLTLEDWTDGT